MAATAMPVVHGTPCSTSYVTSAELRRSCARLPPPAASAAPPALGVRQFPCARAAARRRSADVRARARFQHFEPSGEEAAGGTLDTLPDLVESEEEEEEEVERADSVLPDSLEGTILQASESAALFVQSGGDRGVVELLLPQVANSGETGDQQRLWELALLFLDDLHRRLDTQQLKAVFPDAGVAAMLKHQRRDTPSFAFASLSDRRPVAVDDEVVVLVQPDFQMLPAVERIASTLLDATDGPPRALLMYNPALQSGDVGVGLNVRRMRDYFLSTFNYVYSMRTLSFGAMFRRYPGPWQVFFDDEDLPGRYVLALEEAARPVLEDVEMLYSKRGKSADGAEREPGPLENLFGAFSSMNRFMRSLSR